MPLVPRRAVTASGALLLMLVSADAGVALAVGGAQLPRSAAAPTHAAPVTVRPIGEQPTEPTSPSAAQPPQVVVAIGTPHSSASQRPTTTLTSSTPTRTPTPSPTGAPVAHGGSVPVVAAVVDLIARL